ncbi:uncharacterized protein LOC131624171 [Vicia villosa]|uniref:uncharacterized protein LOC131624171 n=1 Tax=Vicia villosa TaxID=3911 RepID=UPI00273CAE7F|nr:uncharacterized protein LOC131624171 [Vicia villosa]
MHGATASSSHTPHPVSNINELFKDVSEDDAGSGNSSETCNSVSNYSMDKHDVSFDTDIEETDLHNSGEYYDLGDPLFECQRCGANMWYLERKNKCRHSANPKFSMCCGEGKVQIPLLKAPPPVLQSLLFDQNKSESKVFQQQIRLYNMMFSFTSPGAKMDNRFNNGRSPPNYRIQGQSCHRIGSMLPLPGEKACFAQLYIFDTEHEVHNRIDGFWMARDRLSEGNVADLKLYLISERQTDERIYNQPTVLEVAPLIVGDVDTAEKRDIIVQKQCGELQRIDEYHTSYLGFQYPLLFPYGKDGYRPNIRHRNKGSDTVRISETTALVAEIKDVPWEEATKRNRLTIREWFAFRIESRKNEAQTILMSRRLFQQFLVDGFTMMESERLRCYVGFPDLLITFTCNPNWPEIQRVLSSANLKAVDRPDLITRIFKMKFDALLSNLTKKSIMGKVLAYMYTIEFQKRGLPHAHILIFLHPSSKYPTPADIDRLISVEIPNKDTDKDLYNLVKSHMIHGPCGNAFRNSTCMKEGKCSKYFLKDFRCDTIVDQDGYPVYRRRDNGHTISKNGIEIDNRFVVPYNSKLLLKYIAHINMEWCNQSTSVKYLFKYINKGYDRITTAIVMNEDGYVAQHDVVDEIKQYIDCRYVSPSEAAWRIYAFPIHGRKPAVERLHFHAEGQNSVFYTDVSPITTVLDKPSVTESMYTSWFEANKKYDEARQLTYNNFVSKFVYVKKEWKPRLKGYTIGRLIWVPPTTGELYYLRMMLTHVKGPQSYDEIKIVNNVKYDTFRDACFAMGFIGDDREFIFAITEAFQWGSGHYLRLLFVHMLLSSSINRPKHQRIANNRGLRLTNEEILNLTLIEIEKLPRRSHKSLSDFPGMPKPQSNILEELGNNFIYEEQNYDPAEQLQEFNTLYNNLTVLNNNNIKLREEVQNGGVFFLYGYSGTRKTYMWRTLASYIRSRRQICLTVASSGIASLLLPGGRTTHSKFKIPIPTLESSTCDINKGSDRGDLLKVSKLIIWDEAPMCHKFCFEALDKTLRDIMSGSRSSDKIFGGKVLKLTKNMRLQQSGATTSAYELEQFSNWILKVGDGKLAEPNCNTVN